MPNIFQLSLGLAPMRDIESNCSTQELQSSQTDLIIPKLRPKWWITILTSLFTHQPILYRSPKNGPTLSQCQYTIKVIGPTQLTALKTMYYVKSVNYMQNISTKIC